MGVTLAYRINGKKDYATLSIPHFFYKSKAEIITKYSQSSSVKFSLSNNSIIGKTKHDQFSAILRHSSSLTRKG